MANWRVIQIHQKLDELHAQHPGFVKHTGEPEGLCTADRKVSKPPAKPNLKFTDFGPDTSKLYCELWCEKNKHKLTTRRPVIQNPEDTFL